MVNALAYLRSYHVPKFNSWLAMRLLKEGGALKRIILSATLVATTAAMTAANTFSGLPRPRMGSLLLPPRQRRVVLSAPLGLKRGTCLKRGTYRRGSGSTSGTGGAWTLRVTTLRSNQAGTQKRAARSGEIRRTSIPRRVNVRCLLEGA